MEKAKEVISKNKKTILVVVGVGVAIVAFVIGLMILFGSDTKERELNNLLEEMGKEFYENFYYDGSKPTPDERVEFLKGYEKIGVKISLNNLGRYNSTENQKKIKEFINPKTDEPCDGEKTKVIIYPKDPYGKSDYEIKIELACGFESEKEEQTD